MPTPPRCTRATGRSSRPMPRARSRARPFVEAGLPGVAGAVAPGPFAARVAHVREAGALVVAAQRLVVGHDVETEEVAAPGARLVLRPRQQARAEPGTGVGAPDDHAVH